MKVEKNSPLAQMLLKLAAEHDPKLREAIRNGEVEGVNIIAVGGAPDGEVKELLESLAKDEDDCKNCENRDECEDAMHRYSEFAEITDAYFDDSDEENTTETE